MIEEHLGRPLDDEEKQPDTPLDQIGLDSLDRMDIALEIEDRFGFRSDRVADTLGELWALAEGQLTGRRRAGTSRAAAWSRPPSTHGPDRRAGRDVGRGVRPPGAGSTRATWPRPTRSPAC